MKEELSHVFISDPILLYFTHKSTYQKILKIRPYSVTHGSHTLNKNLLFLFIQMGSFSIESAVNS